MRYPLIVLLIIFASTCCLAQKSSASFPKLQLNGTLTVHVKSVPQSTTVPVKLSTYHSFPRADVSVVQDSLSVDRNEIYITTPFRTVGRSFLYLADSSYSVVGAPGDTVEVRVLRQRMESPTWPFVSFEGKNKEIQQFYQAKEKRLNDPVQACMNLGMSAANLLPFQQKMDETYQIQSDFWVTYQKKHALPE
jgi:hypothetical protein